MVSLRAAGRCCCSPHVVMPKAESKVPSCTQVLHTARMQLECSTNHSAYWAVPSSATNHMPKAQTEKSMTKQVPSTQASLRHNFQIQQGQVAPAHSPASRPAAELRPLPATSKKMPHQHLAPTFAQHTHRSQLTSSTAMVRRFRASTLRPVRPGLPTRALDRGVSSTSSSTCRRPHSASGSYLISRIKSVSI